MLLLPRTGPHNEQAALKELKAYVEKNKIAVKGYPFIRYLDNEEIVPEAEMRWQAGVVLENSEVQIQPPYQIEWIPGGLICFSRIESENLEVPENDWLGFVLTFTINGYVAGGYPWKSVNRINKREFDLELCSPVHQ